MFTIYDFYEELNHDFLSSEGCVVYYDKYTSEFIHITNKCVRMPDKDDLCNHRDLMVQFIQDENYDIDLSPYFKMSRIKRLLGPDFSYAFEEYVRTQELLALKEWLNDEGIEV